MDRRSSVEKLDKVLGEGKANGCNVVDMLHGAAHELRFTFTSRPSIVSDGNHFPGLLVATAE